MVKRSVHAGTPPRVSYALTEKGTALRPAIRELSSWAQQLERRLRADAEPPARGRLTRRIRYQSRGFPAGIRSRTSTPSTTSTGVGVGRLAEQVELAGAQ